MLSLSVEDDELKGRKINNIFVKLALSQLSNLVEEETKKLTERKVEEEVEKLLKL